jgi:hypothetical protein
MKIIIILLSSSYNVLHHKLKNLKTNLKIFLYVVIKKLVFIFKEIL